MSLDVDIRSLLNRMNRVTTKALNSSVGACSSRGHYELTCEHFLYAILDETNCDLLCALAHFDIDRRRLLTLVQRSLDRMRSGNSAKPTFSDRVLDWIQAGWLVGSVDLGHTQVRSGSLLLAALGNVARHLGTDYVDILAPIGRDELVKNFEQIVGNSTERGERASAAEPRSAESALGKYCSDLTAEARSGKIDPVLGRDAEIRRVIQILCSRKKNNPIVVGEAGVGKTAVVEGLALRIVADQVPAKLRGVDVLSVDLGLLQAGAGVRGEFEARLKSVIEEVKAASGRVVLFIDEAHTLIGAGGAAGTGDAANLLKPVLARGEMRTIAATTWAEFKLHIEKDQAMMRRFQEVRLDEPSEDTALVILRGLRQSYEAVHQVRIRDDAVEAAVRLSKRYVSGRLLPDKAIDLLDTCAARVKMAQVERPPVLEDLGARIVAAQRHRDALIRDAEPQGQPDPETLQELEGNLEVWERESQELEAQWMKEKEAASAVIESRAAFEANRSEGASKKRLEDAMAQFETTRSSAKTEVGVPVEVTQEVVAATISEWTGIPLGRMIRDQVEMMLEFESHMQHRIKGQEHALTTVGKALRASRAGVASPSTPIGVFLFAGPSGVGKTEMALAIADLLFGDDRSLTTINMSEFKEAHMGSLLKGAPPGYEGYGKGGTLTEAVRHRPYSVVLLDEVEKAHLDVMNLFYQVFDKATMTDGTGRHVDFKNTIIVCTTNLGADPITKLCRNDRKPSLDELTEVIRPEITEHFKPALTGRFTIVPFTTLSEDTMRGIVFLKLERVGKRLRDSHRIDLEYDAKVVEEILVRCRDVMFGARNVDRVVEGVLLPLISTEVLRGLASGTLPKRLKVLVDATNGWSIVGN